MDERISVSSLSSQVDLGIPNCNQTLCRCQCLNEKNKDDQCSLETKDYIIIALAITSFLLLVVLVMIGCYWIRKRKRKRNKNNTRPTENFKINIQHKDITIKDNRNIQETKNDIELVDHQSTTFTKEADQKLDENKRYLKDPTKPEGNTMKKHQSTKTDDYAEVIGPSLESTPDPSGRKGENMVEIGNSKNTHITNNDDLGNQTSKHNPDDGNFYQYITRILVPGGKSNRSTTDLESNASSSESGAETSVTQNIASGSNINIKAKHVTLHIAN